jgi:hypothetical protein
MHPVLGRGTPYLSTAEQDRCSPSPEVVCLYEQGGTDKHPLAGRLSVQPRSFASGRKGGLQEVHRALDTPASSVEDVGVDHGRLHALVAEELLDGADVVAVHQEVGGEGMAEGVAGRRLDEAGGPDGVVECLLDAPVVEVMPPALPRPRIARQGRRREDVLPSPLGGSVGILPCQRVRQVDPSEASPQILLVLLLDLGQAVPQIRLERRRQHGHPVLGALAVPDGDLVVGEVDVLDAQAERFHQAHAGAVEEREEGTVRRSEVREDAFDLVRRQYDGELPPPLGANEPFELAHLALEDDAIEKRSAQRAWVWVEALSSPYTARWVW